MKRQSKLIALWFGLSIFMLWQMPLVFAAGDNAEYLNCLCNCGCSTKGWNCASVACFYEPNDPAGSPECADTTIGPCKCQGFGCGRASLDSNSDCARNCEQYRVSEDCKKWQDDYNANREKYLTNTALTQTLNDYEYKAVSLYYKNWLKLTISFVYENLSPPPTRLNDTVGSAVQSLFLSAAFPEAQSNATKAEIQAGLLRLIKATQKQSANLIAQQKTLIVNMKSAQAQIKAINCTAAELKGLPALPTPTLTLVDLTKDDPRSFAITILQQKGIVKGYSDGTFQINKSINRAEFIKILMESQYPGQANGKSCFTDVNEEWFAPYACMAENQGIVTGFGDGSFKPDQTIIAAEALKMILETTHPADIEETTGGEWWQKYWQSAQNLDILPEDVTASDQSINRGQMAEMIFRALADGMIADQTLWEAPDDLVKNLALLPIDQFSGDVPALPSVSNSNELINNFSDATQGYQMGYPEDWTQETKDDNTMIFLGPKNSNGYSPTINIQKIPGQSAGGLNANIDALLQDLKLQFNEFLNIKYLEEKDLTVGALTAKSMLVEYSYENITMRQWQIVITKADGSMYYTWYYAAPTDLYDQYAPLAQKMLDSWKAL